MNRKRLREATVCSAQAALLPYDFVPGSGSLTNTLILRLAGTKLAGGNAVQENVKPVFACNKTKI